MRQRKLTDEQRLDAVRAYLAGAGSYQAVAERFHISARTLRDLVALYQSQGEGALETPASNNHYSPELKRRAVEDYQHGRGSQREICERYHIRTRTQLRTWIKQYDSDTAPICECPTTVAQSHSSGRKTSLEERVEIVCYCLAHDKDYALTTQHFHVSYQQIYTWVRKYQECGVEGLIDRRGHRKDPADMTPTERLQHEIKLLQAENRRLEIENTALKKLRHLERRWD